MDVELWWWKLRTAARLKSNHIDRENLKIKSRKNSNAACFTWIFRICRLGFFCFFRFLVSQNFIRWFDSIPATGFSIFERGVWPVPRTFHLMHLHFCVGIKSEQRSIGANRGRTIAKLALNYNFFIVNTYNMIQNLFRSIWSNDRGDFVRKFEIVCIYIYCMCDGDFGETFEI